MAGGSAAQAPVRIHGSRVAPVPGPAIARIRFRDFRARIVQRRLTTFAALPDLFSLSSHKLNIALNAPRGCRRHTLALGDGGSARAAVITTFAVRAPSILNAHIRGAPRLLGSETERVASAERSRLFHDQDPFHRRRRHPRHHPRHGAWPKSKTAPSGRIASLFDLIAGTSTGGILALGLCDSEESAAAPLYAAKQLLELCTNTKAHAFSPVGILVTRCGRLRQSLALRNIPRPASNKSCSNISADSRLRDAATDVLIASYEIERSFPFFFRSAIAREHPDYDFPARDVARATSAAPTYFEPMKLPTGTNSDHYTLIDGGVFANNPAACALVEATPRIRTAAIIWSSR